MSEVEHDGGRRRVNSARLPELSDAELVDQLRETISPRGWTLGQLTELQRRGEHIVEGDPAVSQALEESRERRAAFAKREAYRVSEFMEPSAELGERMTNVANLFPKTQFPDWSPSEDLAVCGSTAPANAGYATITTRGVGRDPAGNPGIPQT